MTHLLSVDISSLLYGMTRKYNVIAPTEGNPCQHCCWLQVYCDGEVCSASLTQPAPVSVWHVCPCLWAVGSLWCGTLYSPVPSGSNQINMHIHRWWESPCSLISWHATNVDWMHRSVRHSINHQIWFSVMYRIISSGISRPVCHTRKPFVIGELTWEYLQ